MPFKSKSQQRWMFANHPKMAERWAHHTKDIKSLPEKVSCFLAKLAVELRGGLNSPNPLDALKDLKTPDTPAGVLAKNLSAPSPPTGEMKSPFAEIEGRGLRGIAGSGAPEPGRFNWNTMEMKSPPEIQRANLGARRAHTAVESLAVPYGAHQPIRRGTPTMEMKLPSSSPRGLGGKGTLAAILAGAGGLSLAALPALLMSGRKGAPAPTGAPATASVAGGGAQPGRGLTTPTSPSQGQTKNIPGAPTQTSGGMSPLAKALLLGGGLAAGGYGISKLMGKGRKDKDKEKVSMDNPDVMASGPASSTLAAMLGGAGMGAPAGGLLGVGAGAARGNIPEGLGRGLLRGGLTGGGAALGGVLGNAVSHGSPLGGLGGAGAGGLLAYLLAGKLLGKPAGRRKEARDKQACQLLKRAIMRKLASAQRELACTAMVQYLDKVASELPVTFQSSVRALQQHLTAGKPLFQSIKLAWPQRSKLDHVLLHAHLCKQAAVSCGPMKKTEKKTYQGPPAGGADWMRKQANTSKKPSCASSC